MESTREGVCVCWGGGGGEGGRGGEHINLKRWVGMSESEVWKAQERVGSGG